MTTTLARPEADGAAAAEPPLAVDARSLSKSFRQGGARVVALDDVAIRVRDGEFVAIMGPSGSGKSTLLHVIAGLTRPDNGSVAVAGQDLLAMSDRELTAYRRRHVGVVFQAYNLISTITVEDNILLPAAAGGFQHEAAARLGEILEQLGLADLRRRYPDTLSGGEQQRVAIARALVTKPSIVLADEPTGNLDSVNGAKLCASFRDLHERRGQTLLLVTHDPFVAMWAERVIVLADGRTKADRPTAEFADGKALASWFFELVNELSGGATPCTV